MLLRIGISSTFHDPIISPEITRQNLTVSTNQEIEEQQFEQIISNEIAEKESIIDSDNSLIEE